MSKRNPYPIAPEEKGATKYWKSIEGKENPAEVAARVDAEFPLGVGEVPGVSRRSFLQVAGAGATLLGLEACIRRPDEKILPYSQAPEYLNPGSPMHFATVTNDRGEAVGLLVNSFEGRPTKIEGNPAHPSSLGATDVNTQASILDLYDPDRSNSPAKVENGQFTNATFADWDAELASLITKHAADAGAGLRILSEPTNSPSFVRLRAAVTAKFPQAKFYAWAPVNHTNVSEGMRLAFGAPMRPIYEYSRAKTILSLDADFLQTEPGSVVASRRFADSRRIAAPTDSMSRLYVVEATHSITGAAADHRLALPAAQIDGYLRALAKELSTNHGVDIGAAASSVANAEAPGVPRHWVAAVAKDLAEHRGASILVVGQNQPAHVHALAQLVNISLGNMGRTVAFAPAIDSDERSQLDDIRALAADLDANTVKTLFILGANPVHTAPADLGFGERLAKAEVRVHFSAFRDETSEKCTWQIPRAHELETWGDQKSTDGTLAVQQPLIAPLFGGRSDIELLAQLAGEANWRGYHVVRTTLRANGPSGFAFDTEWRRVLQSGIVSRGQLPSVPPTADAARIGAAVSAAATAPAASKDSLEVVFLPCAKLYDGRHANNAWLLELPEPMTRISWDNAALLSQKTATELGLRSGDIVKLSKGQQSIEIPAWVLPGNAHYSIGLTLGWGREKTGRYGRNFGFDVYPLRTSENLGFASGVRLEKTGRRHEFAQTQDHHDMAGRPIALEASLTEYQADPFFSMKRSPTPRTLPLWREVEYTGHKWGMSIDLNTCTGCGACVIACQSENNIPTVGREMVARGREMHWLRLDRYFLGDDVNELEGTNFQPLACQQCEEAPCENVCPVNATAHSPEGLNDMAYNRCIGTRYCANNCPYKVRRFNYLNWQINHEPSGEVPETKKMQFNPNVTVRTRGVMEKCTYCVQRIEGARIATRIAGRALRSDDITPACAQTCAAQAIVFGDLNDPRSAVSQWTNNGRHYKLLGEVGTQPRTTYLARIRNINPEFPGRASADSSHAEAHG